MLCPQPALRFPIRISTPSRAYTQPDSSLMFVRAFRHRRLSLAPLVFRARIAEGSRQGFTARRVCMRGVLSDAVKCGKRGREMPRGVACRNGLFLPSLRYLYALNGARVFRGRVSSDRSILRGPFTRDRAMMLGDVCFPVKGVAVCRFFIWCSRSLPSSLGRCCALVRVSNENAQRFGSKRARRLAVRRLSTRRSLLCKR